MPGSGLPIPPPPPLPSIPKGVKKEAEDIMPQGGNKHKAGLAKAMEAQRRKIESTGRGV